MSQEIIMPKLGLTMKTGRITKWLKKVGDHVSKGEIVAEIETDKLSAEVESSADGYITEILAEEGEERGITTPIAIVGDSLREVPEKGKTEIRTRITPLAARIAKDNNIDYSKIKGTGPEGRIEKADVLKFLEENNKTADNNIDQLDLSINNTTAPVMEISEKKIPLQGVRKIVAQKMSQSKHEIPHVYFKLKVDITKILELKSNISETIKAQTSRKLSVNEILIKVVAAALKEFPDINVSLVNDDIVYHSNINIGLAVSTEKGLIVSVIKDADQMGFLQLNRIVGELIYKSRNGKILLDDISGGTFTISNLGSYGMNEFTAIINPPESAILAVGAAIETPVAENGLVVIKPMMTMVLSVDHRVIDGSLAAQFLKRLGTLLENPGLLLV